MRKIVIGISVGLLLLAGLLFLGWKLFNMVKVQPLVEDFIEEQLRENLDMDVNFNIGSVHYSLFNKKLRLNDIELVIRDIESGDVALRWKVSSIAAQLNAYRDLKHLDSIVLNDLSIGSGLFDFHPQVKIKSKETDKDSLEEKKSLYLGFDDVFIEDQRVRILQQQETEKGNLHLNIRAEGKDMVYDNQEFKTQGLYSLLKAFHFNIHELKYYFNDDLYSVELARLEVIPGKQYIKADSIVLKPVMGKKSFAKKVGEATDYMTLSIPVMEGKGLTTWQGNGFSIASISLEDVKFTAFRDKNYPLPDDRRVDVLVDKLEASDFPIFIGEVDLKEAYISYSEINKDGDEPGEIFFDKINGTIKTITNISDSLENRESVLRFQAESRVYGKGKLKADIRYFLGTKNGAFDIRGGLSSMALKESNQILEPLTPVKIVDGKAISIFFHFSGNRTNGKGEMRFKYEDLKVEIDEDQAGSQLGQSMLSGLANLVLPKHNPRPNGRFRIGKIEAEKDPRRSMFNFWWLNLQSGFISTLGASDAASIEKDDENKDHSFWKKIGFK